MLSRFLNRSNTGDSPAAEYAMLGDKSVKVPKLTPEKYKLLFERVNVLPQLIVRMLAAKHSDDFAATAIVGAGIALDEAVQLVAILADLEPEYIHQNADLAEITDFIRLTLEKNDLQRVIKNFRAVLGHLGQKSTDRPGGS